MKEKIIGGIIATIMVLSCIGIIVFATPITAGRTPDPVATISEADIPSETTPAEEEVIILKNMVVERVEPTNYDEAINA